MPAAAIICMGIGDDMGHTAQYILTNGLSAVTTTVVTDPWTDAPPCTNTFTDAAACGGTWADVSPCVTTWTDETC